ncbi:MAG: hypothetical protein IPL13_00015 [Saprospiraceae bacterium]|nr:hypothetical protein [Candidatus Brachybacter algidus]
MSNTNNSFDTSIGLEYKDNPNWTDSRRIANYLQYHTATCTMLCKALGIEQKTACRRKELQRKAFYLNYTRAFANTQMRKQPI